MINRSKLEDSGAIIDACLNKPLYQVIASGDDAQKLAKLLREEAVTFDTYCVDCRRDATFKRAAARKAPPTLASQPLDYTPVSLWQTVQVNCTRHSSHMYSFMFAPYGGGIAKVGQKPSAFDIAAADLARFSDILDALDLRELQQAVLLRTHGAAVGAFVYLRRIFERLLKRHRDDVESQRGPLEGFDSLSVEKQVLALKDVLPAEVVQNRKVYRVLSKGIHQLQEDECSALYDVMHAAIVEILERDIYIRQRAKSSAELRRAVADAAGKVSTSEKNSED